MKILNDSSIQNLENKMQENSLKNSRIFNEILSQSSSYNSLSFFNNKGELLYHKDFLESDSVPKRRKSSLTNLEDDFSEFIKSYEQRNTIIENGFLYLNHDFQIFKHLILNENIYYLTGRTSDKNHGIIIVKFTENDNEMFLVIVFGDKNTSSKIGRRVLQLFDVDKNHSEF